MVSQPASQSVSTSADQSACQPISQCEPHFLTQVSQVSQPVSKAKLKKNIILSHSGPKGIGQKIVMQGVDGPPQPPPEFLAEFSSILQQVKSHADYTEPADEVDSLTTTKIYKLCMACLHKHQLVVILRLAPKYFSPMLNAEANKC